jgi:hypothetical protein
VRIGSDKRTEASPIEFSKALDENRIKRLKLKIYLLFLTLAGINVAYLCSGIVF